MTAVRFSRRDAALVTRTEQLVERATALLGPNGNGPAPGAGSAETVAALGDLCIERLRTGAPTPAETGVICELAADLQQLVLDLHDLKTSGRTRRIAACEHGLSRLRALNSSADLIDRASEELNRSCGFGRTLLSRVEDGVWRPWVLHEVQATVDWFGEWRDHSIPLDELTLETQLLTECRPALIADVTAPGVHPIVLTGHSTSYVVAPIMPAGRVVGFFHSDHHPTGRRCDEIDREILWAFADGFGHLYERTALLERLRSQRAQVRETLAGVDGTMEQLAESEIELALQAETGSPLTRTAFSVLRTIGGKLSELTPRELEVLELMVTGAKNQDIAAQLVITEGTVKSHVKHILAKLGAVNRSQAIARYLGVSDEPAA